MSHLKQSPPSTLSKHSFEKLKVWQEAHQFVLSIYKVSTSFPTQEKFGLTSQLRRSAVSIPANIVEGNARISQIEYLRFVNIARSSLAETKYHLMLARDLQYLNIKDYTMLENKAHTIGKMLNGLTTYLKKPQSKSSKI